MQTVGANTAMSILLTSTSNIIAVFTMPFVVSRLLASGSLSLDAGEMTIRLVKSVLLPLLIGATLRSVQQVCNYVKQLCPLLAVACRSMWHVWVNVWLVHANCIAMIHMVGMLVFDPRLGNCR